jgi:hypothetical protein
MTEYMDLTIAISPSVIPWRAKWAASFVASTDMSAGDVATLDKLTGYGDTPLAAAADLLAVAAGKQEQEQEQ